MKGVPEEHPENRPAFRTGLA